MKKKYLALPLGLLVVVTVILSLRPVPLLDEKECRVLKGTVAEIYEDGVKDVVFKLRGQNQIFYVNRGLQRGLNLKKIQTELTGQEIVLKYPNHWTPLDPGTRSVHVSKIEHAGQTVFTELN